MKRVVVKIGSSVLAPQGKLNHTLIGAIVKDILSAEKLGYEIILVSSGAIACGLEILGYKKRPADMYSLMAISSLGQVALMNVFKDKFAEHRRICAQILLSWDDFDDRKRFVNIRKTIEKLLTLKATPIINENDAVSCEEIRFGDNDRLSALCADLIGAKQLIILSDIEGLLSGKNLVKEVLKIDVKVLSLARKEDKTHTAGGMITKLEAAKIATSSGIKTTIANGQKKGVISLILRGELIGTLFLPAQKIDKARKRWIAFSKKIKGSIYIDDGAKEAIINRGKSLLSVGITKVEGEFKKNDAVQVFDKEGNLLGCGIVNYSCDELNHAAKKLEKEVIHRDNFVRVESQNG